jgi:hypothetical protein
MKVAARVSPAYRGAGLESGSGMWGDDQWGRREWSAVGDRGEGGESWE